MQPRTGTTNFGPVWFIFIVGSLEFAWAYWSGYQFIMSASIYAGVALLLAVSFAYGVSGRSQAISDMAYYGALWVMLTVVGVIFTYLAASLRLPLLDADFAKMDALLGFRWLEWYTYVREHPIINVTLLIAYATGLLQICFSIFYFAHTGKRDRNNELWWASIISLLITSILSGIFPALGAYHYNNAGLSNGVHLPDLLALRDGKITTFLVHEMQGIITLPSYHTVLGILFIYAFRGLGVWFGVSCVVNIMMLISTPSHGGHYLVDMIAGGLVAVGAIYFVRGAKKYFAGTENNPLKTTEHISQPSTT